MPTLEIIRPIIMDSRPLIRLSEEMLVTMLNPNTASAKFSGAPKFRANFASSGAVTNRHRAENTPPKVEAKVDMPSARPASPRNVMG